MISAFHRDGNIVAVIGARTDDSFEVHTGGHAHIYEPQLEISRAASNEPELDGSWTSNQGTKRSYTLAGILLNSRSDGSQELNLKLRTPTNESLVLANKSVSKARSDLRVGEFTRGIVRGKSCYLIKLPYPCTHDDILLHLVFATLTDEVSTQGYSWSIDKDIIEVQLPPTNGLMGFQVYKQRVESMNLKDVPLARPAPTK